MHYKISCPIQFNYVGQTLHDPEDGISMTQQTFYIEAWDEWNITSSPTGVVLPSSGNMDMIATDGSHVIPPLFLPERTT